MGGQKVEAVERLSGPCQICTPISGILRIKHI